MTRYDQLEQLASRPRGAPRRPRALDCGAGGSGDQEICQLRTLSVRGIQRRSWDLKQRLLLLLSHFSRVRLCVSP